ncbi:MAG: Ni/Fe hydrogenase subunit alpha [Planctomycetales bacterium]|nr:Ni/Fe hydrogenase subunit alpha [Planctomycetales bacterium]
MTSQRTRTIEVGAITRVEGEGALRVKIENGVVQDVQLSIYEPPRFFEALLRGRPLEDVPDITARICGICPIAYQMTAVHALEQALGVRITSDIRRLRRLLYCGEWIESHGVHMHLLHIPDFFGCASSIELAKRYPDEVNRGLRLKKIGNRLLEVTGGRAVHPINVAVGGFYRAPRRSELQSLRDDFLWGLDASIDVTKWVARFDFPDFVRDYEMVALRHPDEYPMNEGRLVSTAGLDIPSQEFEAHFDERQVPHSTALQAVRLPTETNYFVGPLARVNLNRQLLYPAARQLSDDVGIAWPCMNPYQSIVARGLEVVHAFEEALSIIDDYQGCAPAKIAYEPQAGEGAWATEAPRGMIYHRYRTTSEGLIEFAKIVPPTSQNQRQIEVDLRTYLPSVLELPDAELGMACERLIRSYDPCISCATHFLKLEIDRR